jgi:hypothetical protein
MARSNAVAAAEFRLGHWLLGDVPQELPPREVGEKFDRFWVPDHPHGLQGKSHRGRPERI